MLFYLLCLSIGGISFFIDVLSKVAGFIGVKALSLLFSKMGCSSALAFVIGCAFRALVTTEASPSLAHWMLPGPSHQPHVAEEDYLRDHPVAHRSAPPVGLEVIKPVIEDGQRYDELEGRLNRHLLENSDQISTTAYHDLVDKQHIIEKSIEEELLHDEYSRDRIYTNRYEIRECLFYKKGGVPLKEKTLDLYLKEIQRNPSHSIPYRKIQKKIKSFKIDFFFLNSSFGRELSLETISLVPTLPHSAISV
ncbi:hypothetical protein Hdeb2414_s0017g00506031 [Helianthus debilis subsp. tardiflorus]